MGHEKRHRGRPGGRRRVLREAKRTARGGPECAARRGRCTRPIRRNSKTEMALRRTHAVNLLRCSGFADRPSRLQLGKQRRSRPESDQRHRSGIELRCLCEHRRLVAGTSVRVRRRFVDPRRKGVLAYRRPVPVGHSWEHNHRAWRSAAPRTRPCNTSTRIGSRPTEAAIS